MPSFVRYRERSERVKPAKQSDVGAAVRDLRTALGESQEQFAARLGTAVRTISRYEAPQPPKGGTLLRLLQIAREHHVDSAAATFAAALREELEELIRESGFLEILREQIEKEFTPVLMKTVEERIAAGLVDVTLREEEQEVLVSVLRGLRAADSPTRTMMVSLFRDADSVIRLVRRTEALQQFETNLHSLDTQPQWTQADQARGEFGHADARTTDRRRAANGVDCGTDPPGPGGADR